METFTSASSFETNLTFENRNSFRDASFSSYLNKSEENMILKLTNSTLYGGDRKKPEEDDEIGVFGAEKYFKGEMVDEEGDTQKDMRFLHKIHDQKQEKYEEFDELFAVKNRIDREKTRTPSVRSMSSLNSRSALLPPRNQARKPEKGKTRSFLANLGCNCIDRKSIEISDNRFIHGHGKEILKPPMKKSDFDQKTETLSSNWARVDVRDDYFSFPVLNSKNLTSNSNFENLAGKVLGDNNGGLSLGRKINLLTNWDVGIPSDDELYIPSSGMYNNDVDSDASSDLFEIESFSTAGNSSFFAHQTSESNCYAPSEVSIEWSVVTASAADYSPADYEEVRMGGGAGRSSGGNGGVKENKDKYKKRVGILSGCKSQKSVRVAGDEYRVLSGEKAAGGGGLGRPRRRQSDSAVFGSGFLGENNVGGFDRRRGHYGSDMCSVSGARGPQLLYIQQ